MSEADDGKAKAGKLDKNAMWIEKYRPKSLNDVAAHKEIITTRGSVFCWDFPEPPPCAAVKKLVAENRLPHLLFYGPPGTGKTSTILAVARQIYGNSMSNMVLELNASDDRGIGVVRQQVVDFASTRTIFSNSFKLVILDECDAMTKDAQFALRRVIEKYTRNTRFCLICNYVSKIIPALQSRCTRFRFPPLEESYVKSRLGEICKEENVKLGEGGLEALATLGAGDMRRSLNILQSTYMATDEVSEESVYSCTGSPMPRDMEEIAGWLFNEEFATCFKNILDMQMEKGLALLDIVQGLHPWVFRVDMPAKIRINLVERLADIENNLTSATSERLQLGGLIGGFTDAKDAIVAAAV